MKGLFILVFIFLGVLPYCAMADSNSSCNENGRCINGETNSYGGFTFTPSYKNQYIMMLLNIDESCEADQIKKASIIPLPKNSYFRQTLDKDSQTTNEMLVHVYELDIQADENSATDDAEFTIERYFSSAFKVCLNGKHRVQKSNYKRVGGVSTGVLVVPFKLRSGDIYSDSTIGPYISYKWEVIEVLVTGGLSQVSISQVGTEDVESETGLTAALGVNFAVDKNWDVALITGVDHLSGDTGDKWEYQDKVWVSFGIGFNFTR